MILDELAARLKPLGNVEGVLSLASLDKNPPAISPTLYVAPVMIAADGNRRTTGPVLQRVSERYAVVIAMQDRSGKNSLDQNSQLQTLINDIEA